MFPEKLTVTSIKRVIYVSKDEYKSKVTSFKNDCLCNEIIFQLSGEREIHFNGKVFNTKKGTVRFLPKCKVDEYTVIRKTNGDCIDIFFDTDIQISENAFCINSKDDKYLESLFRKAFSVWSGKRKGYYHKTLSVLYEIIGELSEPKYSPESKESIIEPAVKYISENYLNENISVPHLAEVCNVSETYLKNLFNLRFGVSPKKYITKLKMEYAVELMSSSLFPISRIAEILNYENIYYFSRVFKKEMGISPTEYMNKCKSSK